MRSRACRAASTGPKITMTWPWSTRTERWSPNGASVMTPPGSGCSCSYSPTPETTPRTRSRWPSRPPGACWWPACAPPDARCTRSTRRRCTAPAIATRSRGRNPTPGMRSCWPTSCAPTKPPTGPCQPIPNWPRRSRYSPAPSKTRYGSAILAAAPTPADAAKLTKAQLRKLLAQAGRQRGIDAEADRLHAVLRAQYLHHPQLVEDAFGMQALALLRQLNLACSNADELAAAAVAHFDQHPDAEIITSLPGLGSLTGARVLAEIGDDRSRFADARSLKAYAGSAPVTRASGKSLTVTHRRVKNQRLAAVGYVWAFASLTASPGARAHYDQRRNAGDRHTAAQRNLFNRLLGCLHHCLQTRQHYNEQIAFPTDSTTQGKTAA